MKFSDFCRCPRGVRVALLGFGRANRAVLDWLLAGGALPTVLTEQAPDAEAVAYLQRVGVPLLIGGFPPQIDADVLVRSPGLRPDLPLLAAHRAAGGLATEESALTRTLLPCPLIGVTGSDGKTTTAALSAALLRASGKRVWLGGNNGTPLLGRIAEMRETDVAVMELSSFQLIEMPLAANTAIITNITPNHLNWHTDMAEYVAAKCRIFDIHTRLITNGSCALTRAIGDAHIAAGGRAVFFSQSPLDCENGAGQIFTEGDSVLHREDGKLLRYPCLADFRLAGKHNRENLLAALAATAPYLTDDAPSRALPHFYGVPHRLQYVATVGDVRYYNSSIDTSPTRTAAALSALGIKPIVIAGGRGKGIPLKPFGELLAKNTKAVCLYGEAAGEIAAGLGKLPHTLHTAFAAAFAAAVAFAAAGDTVLLSPGCTAFGEFRDFEERGSCFCRLVKELAAERK
ncbi:MAG: UDP-N-acetylmuramoyl-L-alanine--D-glutamate ligase [Clostridia bacterium]|nr:UDP-N-acetylmuramoyl-L-alanine--D-glutamate ligase [Clostridia bacterium]